MRPARLDEFIWCGTSLFPSLKRPHKWLVGINNLMLKLKCLCAKNTDDATSRDRTAGPSGPSASQPKRGGQGSRGGQGGGRARGRGRPKVRDTNLSAWLG